MIYGTIYGSVNGLIYRIDYMMINLWIIYEILDRITPRHMMRKSLHSVASLAQVVAIWDQASASSYVAPRALSPWSTRGARCFRGCARCALWRLGPGAATAAERSLAVVGARRHAEAHQHNSGISPSFVLVQHCDDQRCVLRRATTHDRRGVALPWELRRCRGGVAQAHVGSAGAVQAR